MFTSRSAVECYKDCNRYRYNQYFLGGKGVVRKQKSVPLVTGSAVHSGVEYLLRRVRIGLEPDIETAVFSAVKQYVTDVENVGFSGKQLQTDKQQWFTFNEQKALTEALIRAWYLKELPQIVARYKVLAVEREINPIEIAPDIWFQAKVDAELQELSSGDYHNYSLKTASQWGDRNEESYKSDLQGCTEIWAVEEDARLTNKRLDEILVQIDGVTESEQYQHKNWGMIKDFVGKRKIDKKISGIRFCYLVKGRWMVPPIFREDPTACKVTYSPLIRGYKNISPSGIAYAHSWNYPNPDNKSGMGALGRGWEPFNVWETDMGVKGWMEMLAGGEIQPNCGDIIKAQVVTPPEYWRSEEEMLEAMRELIAQEKRIYEELEVIELSAEYRPKVLDSVFSHNRKHCFFHFGGTCEYMDLCWKPEVKEDPTGSGIYEERAAHHEAERNQ